MSNTVYIMNAAAFVGTKQITAKQALTDFWGEDGTVYILQHPHKPNNKRIVWSAGPFRSIEVGGQVNVVLDTGNGHRDNGTWNVLDIVDINDPAECLAIKGKGYCFK